MYGAYLLTLFFEISLTTVVFLHNCQSWTG